MKIKLPRKINGTVADLPESERTITVIGANGSGKTRFGSEIERSCGDAAYRISAMKALCVYRRPDSPDANRIEMMYREAVSHSRYISQEIPTEFEQLLFLLLSEEFRTLMAYKREYLDMDKPAFTETRLDTVQRLWESVFPQNKMLRVGGSLQITSGSGNEPFAPLRLSDGEKAVLYNIGAVALAPEKAVVLVEDPEMYLHHSIMKSLWDSIEELRPDCRFVYLTHDIEFASSRLDSVCIWVKSFDADRIAWDYEFIHTQDGLPEGVYLDILGSRKPVLFIEGTANTSIDSRLYPYIFPEWTVKPLGGCNKVIEATRAFADLKALHHLDSHGIVDRDRRTEREVAYLRERNVFVPDVAEVENLLLLEGVVRTVARRMRQPDDRVFAKVRQNVIKLFAAELESQALLHTRHQIRRALEHQIDRRFTDVDAFAEHIGHLTDDTDVKGWYNRVCDRFRTYVRENDYRSVLKVYNQKSMLTQSNLPQLCGLSTKDKYLNMVLNILKENKKDAERIRRAIRSCFELS